MLFGEACFFFLTKTLLFGKACFFFLTQTLLFGEACFFFLTQTLLFGKACFFFLTQTLLFGEACFFFLTQTLLFGEACFFFLTQLRFQFCLNPRFLFSEQARILFFLKALALGFFSEQARIFFLFATLALFFFLAQALLFRKPRFLCQTRFFSARTLLGFQTQPLFFLSPEPHLLFFLATLLFFGPDPCLLFLLPEPLLLFALAVLFFFSQAPCFLGFLLRTQPRFFLSTLPLRLHFAETLLLRQFSRLVRFSGNARFLGDTRLFFQTRRRGFYTCCLFRGCRPQGFFLGAVDNCLLSRLLRIPSFLLQPRFLFRSLARFFHESQPLCFGLAQVFLHAPLVFFLKTSDARQPRGFVGFGDQAVFFNAFLLGFQTVARRLFAFAPHGFEITQPLLFVFIAALALQLFDEINRLFRHLLLFWRADVLIGALVARGNHRGHGRRRRRFFHEALFLLESPHLACEMLHVIERNRTE